MTQFVRFMVEDATHFAALQAVFDELKTVKNRNSPVAPQDVGGQNELIEHDLDRLRSLMPPNVQSNFIWPSGGHKEDHRLPPNKPLAISPPGTFLGAEWSINRILDLIDSCEYSLDRCDMVDASVGELHVITWSYPYGGLNALIALVEGFGFHVLGVNECGEYEPLDQNSL